MEVGRIRALLLPEREISDSVVQQVVRSIVLSYSDDSDDDKGVVLAKGESKQAIEKVEKVENGPSAAVMAMMAMLDFCLTSLSCC